MLPFIDTVRMIHWNFIQETVLKSITAQDNSYYRTLTSCRNTATTSNMNVTRYPNKYFVFSSLICYLKKIFVFFGPHVSLLTAICDYFNLIIILIQITLDITLMVRMYNYKRTKLRWSFIYVLINIFCNYNKYLKLLVK